MASDAHDDPNGAPRPHSCLYPRLQESPIIPVAIPSSAPGRAEREGERARGGGEVFQEIWPLRGAARVMLLDQWCGEDSALRVKVEAMLEADGQTPGAATLAKTGAFLAGQIAGHVNTRQAS